MTDKPLERPRQVTLSGWLIMIGSVFIVLSAFERVAGLTSLESQETAARLISEPPGDGLGLSVNGVQSIIRVLCMVVAASAVVSAGLGWQVMQRSRSARVVLSVLAPVLFFAGAAVSGFTSSLVAAAIVLLWLQPSRDWFAGRPARPQPERASVRERQSAPAGQSGQSQSGPSQTDIWPPSLPAAPAAPGQDQGPRTMTGFGDARPEPVASPDAAAPTRRPVSLVWACSLTWVFSGLTVVGTALSVLVLAVAPELVLDQLREQDPELVKQGITESTLRTATFVSAAVLIPWCIAAIVVAALAFRRRAWARTSLIVSAALAAALSVLALLGNVVGVLPLVACLVTLVLLGRPEVRAWFRARGSMNP